MQREVNAKLAPSGCTSEGFWEAQRGMATAWLGPQPSLELLSLGENRISSITQCPLTPVLGAGIMAGNRTIKVIVARQMKYSDSSLNKIILVVL